MQMFITIRTLESIVQTAKRLGIGVDDLDMISLINNESEDVGWVAKVLIQPSDNLNDYEYTVTNKGIKTC